MPPWFIGAGVVALALALTQVGKKKPGAPDESGAGGDSSGADDKGSGAEGAYVIPGEGLDQFGQPRLPGYEQYQGDEGGGDNTGFGESYGYSTTPVYQVPTSDQLAAAAGLGWNVQSIPNYSSDVAGGAPTVPYVTDVGGQGAYVTPQGSVFEGQLPTYSPSPSPAPYNNVPLAQLPSQKLRQLQ